MIVDLSSCAGKRLLSGSVALNSMFERFSVRIASAARVAGVHTDTDCQSAGCGRFDRDRWGSAPQQPKNGSHELAVVALSTHSGGLKNDRCRAFVSEQDGSHAKNQSWRCLSTRIQSRKESAHRSRSGRGKIVVDSLQPTGSSGPRKLKFPATLEADLVSPSLDREHTAHLLMTAPKNKSKNP